MALAVALLIIGFVAVSTEKPAPWCTVNMLNILPVAS